MLVIDHPTSRALVLFSSMVSGFDNVHIRANLTRLEEALKYGQSAGDKSVSLDFSMVMKYQPTASQDLH